MSPIVAKNYILDNWNSYNLVDSREEMVSLLNILQACGENLDTLHDVCCNGYTMFADIVGTFEDDRDVVKALYEFNSFYTEGEFIDYMLDRIEDLKYDEYEDIASEIHSWTYDDEFSDTKVEKTEDGYVVRVWY